MTFALNIHLTRLEFPRLNVLVLVEGGLARWNGKYWISETYSEGDIPIKWEVKWWADLPVNPFNIHDKL